eukprot:706447-Amphidinium_carterae.1
MVLLGAIFMFAYVTTRGGMVVDDILASLSSAFHDSGFAEENFMGYQGGNPAAVRSEIMVHLMHASKKDDAADAVPHLAIVAAFFIFAFISSRVGPKTWRGLVTGLG